MAGLAATANAAPACVNGTSLDSFTSCTIGDKTFTKIDESLPATVTLEFVKFDSTYLLNINDIDASGPADFFLNYTILVEDPNAVITSISVDSNVQPVPPQVTGGTSVAKDIFDANNVLLGSIESLDGDPDVLMGLSDSFLRIAETFSVEEGQQLFDASNAVTQVSTVPEPAALLIFGVSLTALGLMRRRQRGA